MALTRTSLSLLLLLLLLAAAAAPGAFKHDTKLEVLKLGWCKVGGGEGARALADLVMFNNSLVQVRLIARADLAWGDVLRIQ
jgi:hypothetical protein